MRKSLAVFGSVLFFFVAPGTVAGVIPWAITRWVAISPNWPPMAVLPIAVVLIASGLVVLLDSFVRFAVQGLGTPTPLLPTNQLIVTGLYRHVRNPMYVAILSMIAGQALLFGAKSLAIYATMVWAVFHISVIAYEEPRLRADYGDAFDGYCRHVRRWLPRWTAWRGS